MQAIRIADLACLLDAKFEGNGNVLVERPVNPDSDDDAGALAIATAPEFAEKLRDRHFKAAVLADGDNWQQYGLEAAIFVSRPRYALATITRHFSESRQPAADIHPTAIIDEGASIGDAVSIGPFCTIETGAVIGDRTQILDHVTINAGAVVGTDCLVRSGVRIGQQAKLGHRVIVHQNAVIGADGFSFVTPEPSAVEVAAENTSGEVHTQNGHLARIYSLGAVTLGDDVEIGAGTTIDKGTLADTRIGAGTKIDNQVQIGHNVTIGRGCILCAQVGIAGSAQIGDRVVLGGKSGISDNVKVGSDVLIAAASAVGSNVASQSIMMGIPAQKRDEALRLLVALRRLPSTTATVAKIRKSLKLSKS